MSGIEADIKAKKTAEEDYKKFSRIPKEPEYIKAFLKESGYTTLLSKKLIHKDADGKAHCYLLEIAAKNGIKPLVDILLEMKEVKTNPSVIENAREIEKREKDQLAAENREFIKQIVPAKDDMPIEQQLAAKDLKEKIAQINDKVGVYAEIDNNFAFALKEIAERENSKKKAELLASTKQSFDESLRLLQAPAQAALEVGLKTFVDNETGLEENLKKVYALDTPETREDRELFNNNSAIFEEKIKRERDTTRENFYKNCIRFRNLVQKKGVETTIYVGGLVAIGLTTGGIGVGLFLLSKAIEFGIEKEHEAWLEKYHALSEANQKLLDESQKILIEAEKRLLKKLETLSDLDKEKNDPILNAQIEALNKNIKRLEDLEREAETLAIEALTELLSSTDEATRTKANRFLKEFNQSTRALKEEGTDAFGKLRDDAGDVAERALRKSAEATKSLRSHAATPLKAIGSEAYNTLAYTVFESQASVSDIVDSIDQSCNVFAEVQRRQDLLIKLSQALRERWSPPLLEKQLKTPLAKRQQTVDLKVKERLANTVGQGTEEIINMIMQISNQTTVLDGAASGAAEMIETLKQKGAKDALQDPIFQRKFFTMIMGYGIPSALGTLAQDAANLTADSTAATSIIASSTGVKEGLISSYNALTDTLTSSALTGIPGAQLAIGGVSLSPASAGTMLTLLLYMMIHNMYFSKKLRAEVEKIAELYQKNDISNLNEEEFMKLLKLVGNTIHDFAKVLPEGMEANTDNTQKLFKKEEKRVRLLAELNKEGENPEKAKKLEATLRKNRAKIDALLISVKKEQANQQAAQYLASIYLEMIDHAATKTGAVNDELLVELFRQEVFITALKSSQISPANHKKASPLIAQYLELRSHRINQLNYLKLLGTLTDDQKTELQMHETEVSKNRFGFLNNIKLPELESKTENLSSRVDALRTDENLPENIAEILATQRRLDLFTNEKMWIPQDSKVRSDFKNELQQGTLSLDKFKAYLDSVEKLNSLSITNSEIFKEVSAKNKTLWENFFDNPDNIKSCLARVDAFCEKIERLERMRTLMVSEIAPQNKTRQTKELDKYIAERLLDAKNDNISFDEFLSSHKKPNSELEMIYEDTIKKINLEALEALKEALESDKLSDCVETTIKSLITLEQNKKFNVNLYAKQMRALDKEYSAAKYNLRKLGDDDQMGKHKTRYDNKVEALRKKLPTLGKNIQNREGNIKLDFNIEEYAKKMKHLNMLAARIKEQAKLLQWKTIKEDKEYKKYKEERDVLIENLLKKVQDDNVSAKAFGSLALGPFTTSPIESLTKQLKALEPPEPANSTRALTFSEQRPKPESVHKRFSIRPRDPQATVAEDKPTLPESPPAKMHLPKPEKETAKENQSGKPIIIIHRRKPPAEAGSEPQKKAAPPGPKGTL